MEIEWRRRHWQGYLREAEAAKQRLAAGDRSLAFLRRIVQLLHTYFHSPRAGEQANTADDTLVRLAFSVHAYVHYQGEWRAMAAIYRQAAAALQRSSNRVAYADAVKLLAITLTNQGNHTEALTLYEQVIGHRDFARLPVTVQTDLLVHAGTCHVWHGDARRAQTLLQRAVIASADAATHPIYQMRADANGIYSFAVPIRLWESRAYAFNQLGCLALFCGRFEEAESLYRHCHDLLVAHDGLDNLACVAYQALGRLRLYQGRYAEAASLLVHGLAIRRRWQDKANIALNATYLGGALVELGDLAAAEALFCEAMAIARPLDAAATTALCHLYLGQLELVRGNDQAVFTQWRQALALLRTLETPLVELRVLLIYLPWLLRKGKLHLCAAIGRQLERSIRRQHLGPRSLWRLVKQVGLRL